MKSQDKSSIKSSAAEVGAARKISFVATAFLKDAQLNSSQITENYWPSSKKYQNT